jgi:predicted DNA-binding protein YlxM (UPF0122 family)
MNIIDFFLKPSSVNQKKYEALRMYYVENATAAEVAETFGYSYRAVTSLVTEFRKQLSSHEDSSFLFRCEPRGRKIAATTDTAKSTIIALRKQYHSVSEIKAMLDAMGFEVSERNIHNIIAADGFARLPRRTKMVKQQLEPVTMQADKSSILTFEKQEFKSSNAGILALLPYLVHYKIDQAIINSDYPETSHIPRLQSILCFLAIKLANRRRYSADDTWCMDRGLGLFAGLNVLPKAAWFTSYSDRVISSMNLNFLKSLHKIWKQAGLLQDTVNLDFSTIPYWGDGDHLDNHWSGKRGKALKGMLAVLAQDPDSGIINYGSTTIRKENESNEILEFLDFYHQAGKKGEEPKYLIFDSKFTTYQNLSKLNKEKIRFITIRRRGKLLIESINALPRESFKTIRVVAAGNTTRSLRVLEEVIELKGYEGEIRQITVTGNGKIKPALIITNDFDLSLEAIVRRYARRWIVEKTISEQIEFFHLNLVSSSMVIKVDFDLTMSILAYNIYKLFATELPGYEKLAPQSLFEKFIENEADIKIKNNEVQVSLKKKRNLPMVLEASHCHNTLRYSWLNNRRLNICGASYL